MVSAESPDATHVISYITIDPNATLGPRTVYVESRSDDQLHDDQPDGLTVRSGNGEGSGGPAYVLLHDKLRLETRLLAGGFGGQSIPGSLQAEVARVVPPNFSLNVNLGSPDEPVTIFGRENALADKTTSIEWMFYFLSNYSYSSYQGDNHTGGFEAGTSLRGHLVSNRPYDLYLEPYLSYAFSGAQYANPNQYLPNGYDNSLRAGVTFGSDDLVKDWFSARLLFVESEFDWFTNQGFNFQGESYGFPFEGMPNGNLTSYLIRGGTDLKLNLSALDDRAPDIRIVLAGVGGQSAVIGLIDPSGNLLDGSTIENMFGFEGDLSLRFSKLKKGNWGDLAIDFGASYYNLGGWDPVWGLHGSIAGDTYIGRIELDWAYNNGLRLNDYLAPMNGEDSGSVYVDWTWPRRWFRCADAITLRGGVDIFNGQAVGGGAVLFNPIACAYDSSDAASSGSEQ